MCTTPTYDLPKMGRTVSLIYLHIVQRAAPSINYCNFFLTFLHKPLATYDPGNPTIMPAHCSESCVFSLFTTASSKPLLFKPISLPTLHTLLALSSSKSDCTKLPFSI